MLQLQASGHARISSGASGTSASLSSAHDALSGAPLLSVLSQMPDGYTSRSTRPFLASAALCGLRDVRDCAAGQDPDRTGSASPFNITVKSLRMSDFSRGQVGELYARHTADSGQEFTPEAADIGV